MDCKYDLIKSNILDYHGLESCEVCNLQKLVVCYDTTSFLCVLFSRVTQL